MPRSYSHVLKWLTCTALAVVAAVSGSISAQPERDGIWILNNLSAARAEAKKSGKPIFVVFRCER